MASSGTELRPSCGLPTQVVDPASPPVRALEAIAQASLDAYTPRIQVRACGEVRPGVLVLILDLVSAP